MHFSRLRKFVLCHMVFIVALALLFAVSARETSAANRWIEYVIQPGGSAKFLLTDGSNRVELWTVNCRVPMRSCIARGQGLMLWVDGEMQVHLIAAIAPNARISVVWDNQSQDWPNLFASPLTDDAIQSLTRRNASLVIEERETVALNSRTEGIALLVDYLRWMKTDKARRSRDARMWDNGVLESNFDAPSPELSHLRETERAFYRSPAFLVPYTKPQVEFAISAQNGRSFYVEKNK